MNLFEIEKSINDLLEVGYQEFVDEETGEFDEEAFNKSLSELEVEKSQKIENIGLFIKNLNTDIADLKAEEKAMAERRKAKERKVESLKRFLSAVLNGEKFETAKLALSFRRSEQVQIVDEKKIPEEFMKIQIIEKKIIPS